MTFKYYGNYPTTRPWDLIPVFIYTPTVLNEQAWNRAHILCTPANYKVTLPASGVDTAGQKITFVHGHSSGTAHLECKGEDTILFKSNQIQVFNLDVGEAITLEDTGKGQFIPVAASWDSLKDDVDYAPLNNPVFTGNPQAPTAPEGDDSLLIANTEWVMDLFERAGLLHTSTKPEILDLNSVELSAFATVPTGAIGGPAGLEDTAGFMLNRIYDSGSSGFQLYQPVSTSSLFWRKRYENVWGEWTELTPNDSPNFVGTPLVPTPDGTIHEQIANLGYAQTQVERVTAGKVRFDTDGTWISPITGTVWVTGSGAGGGGMSAIMMVQKPANPDAPITINSIAAEGGGGGGGAYMVRVPVQVSKGQEYSIIIGKGGLGGIISLDKVYIPNVSGSLSNIYIYVNGVSGGATSFGGIVSLEGGEGGRLARAMSNTDASQYPWGLVSSTGIPGKGGEGYIHGVSDPRFRGSSGEFGANSATQGTGILRFRTISGSSAYMSSGGNGGGPCGGRGTTRGTGGGTNYDRPVLAEKGGLGSGGGGGGGAYDIPSTISGEVDGTSGANGGDGFLVLEWEGV